MALIKTNEIRPSGPHGSDTRRCPICFSQAPARRIWGEHSRHPGVQSGAPRFAQGPGEAGRWCWGPAEPPLPARSETPPPRGLARAGHSAGRGTRQLGSRFGQWL